VGLSEHLRIDDTTALLNSAMKEFAPDGALLDVYIGNTAEADWQKLIDYVRNSGLDWKFTVNDKSTRLPESVDALLQTRLNCLSITVNSVDLRSYFFAPEVA
jgi:hypothetical protein